MFLNSRISSEIPQLLALANQYCDVLKTGYWIGFEINDDFHVISYLTVSLPTSIEGRLHDSFKVAYKCYFMEDRVDPCWGVYDPILNTRTRTKTYKTNSYETATYVALVDLIANLTILYEAFLGAKDTTILKPKPISYNF